MEMAVDKDINEGFDEQQEYYDETMNQGYFVDYIEPGLYQTSDLTSEKYEATHLNLKADWDYLQSENILAVEDSVLRTGLKASNPADMEKINKALDGDLVLNGKAIVIRKDCFADCKNLSSVYIKSTQSIEDGAFKNCEKLKTIYINSTALQVVGKKIFKGTNLKDIYYNGTKEQFGKIEWAQLSGLTVTIHCTDQDFQATI